MSRRSEPPEEVGCPMWMVSFGDAMSLLVTFFVMLIAFSDLEEANLLELMGAMKGGFRMTPSQVSRLGTSQEGLRIQKEVGKGEGAGLVPEGKVSKMSATEPMLQSRYSMQMVGEFDRGFMLRLLKEGLTIVIFAERLFVPGTADFVAGHQDVLGVITDLAWQIDNEIRVVCVLPDDMVVRSSRVSTPWGLAAERSLGIKERIQEVADLEEDRFSIGVRVEEQRVQSVSRERADRMEVMLVGFRDVSGFPPEWVVVEDRWD